MADGGLRPAYNVQFTTTTDRQVIVGVEVATAAAIWGSSRRCSISPTTLGPDPEESIVNGGPAP